MPALTYPVSVGGLGQGDACDLVGRARPFYPEPRLPARLRDEDDGAAVVCDRCNDCTVPQVTGAECT